MGTIETARLLLVATPLQVLRTRLGRDDFVAAVPVQLMCQGQPCRDVWPVHFPPEWPGDALALVPRWARQLTADPRQVAWGGTMVERATRVAVGQMSFMGRPDAHGRVELGYGVNPSFQGRGYATEMARALVAWAAGQPTVRRISAQCREDNHASIRVLEKVGFRPVGRRVEDDEPLIVWEWNPDAWVRACSVPDEPRLAQLGRTRLLQPQPCQWQRY